MPVTAGPVPGMTDGLRRVPADPKRFRSGRWFLLAEGVLVSVFGIAGLISAALRPHVENTRAPVSGMASTPAHSAILLALGLVAIVAVGSRRAAVTVTALSAVGYLVLLFVSSVGAARGLPTPSGWQSAGVLLHGVLAVVNLALLMWLIPDELGDETWVPRRRRGRARSEPTAASRSTPPPATSTSPHPVAPQPSQSEPTERRTVFEETSSQEENEPRSNVENATQVTHLAGPAKGSVLSRGHILALAVLFTVIGIVIWARRR
jgi:hypothetical protein